MGLSEYFPHTNFHEQNQDWYLRKTIWLLKEVSTLKAYVDEQLEAMRDTLDGKILEWQRQLDDLQADITQSLADIIKQTNDTLAEAKADIDALIAEQEKRLDEIMEEIQSQYWQIKAYVDGEINKLKDLINKPIEGPVYNPFRQKITTIQVALYDYYNFLAPHAFTTGWWDTNGLTAGEWDNLEETAIRWDMAGLLIIMEYKKSWPWYSYSPWTGMRVSNSNLIYQLAQYHGVGLTCGQWDTMEYTAGEFDTAQYTAYDLDWTNKPLALDKTN